MKRRIREQDEVGELNIVPYLDIVTNLVMFMLLSMAGLITLGIINVGAPKLGGEPQAAQAASPSDEPKLLLTVAISKKGFYIAGSGGVLGGPADATSVDATQPPTVPLRGSQYDFDALTQMMRKIKDRYPKEGNLIILAENDIPYETLVHTMDACREMSVKLPNGTIEHKMLFPEVWLSLLT